MNEKTIKLGDMVTVFWDGELYHKPVKVVWISENGKALELESEEGNIFQHVSIKDVKKV